MIQILMNETLLLLYLTKNFRFNYRISQRNVKNHWLKISANFHKFELTFV
jgi:hypothetical protein